MEASGTMSDVAIVKEGWLHKRGWYPLPGLGLGREGWGWLQGL